MTRTLTGTVKGNSIVFDEQTGVPDGEKVEVTLRTTRLPAPPPGWKLGSSKTAAGMLADSWTAEDDKILDEIEQDRRRDERPEIAE